LSTSAASCPRCGRPISPPTTPYGQFQQQAYQPYQPPIIHVSGPPVEQGSYLLGFLGGFFFGCLGLVLIMMMAKGANTKSGAALGFIFGLVLGLLIVVMGAH
jgi:hypothetical protein